MSEALAGRLPDPLRVAPKLQLPTRVRVRLPGSKSVTNRALVLAALATGESTLVGAELDAADGATMQHAVAALGARVVREATGKVRVEGVGGRPAGNGRIDARDSGTTARFTAAVAALAAETVAIDGSQRLRERPMEPLFAALQCLGARVNCTENPGRLPVEVCADGGVLIGGDVEIAGNVSSQFASALLMIGACCERGLTLALSTPAVSEPYIGMTLALLERVGVRAQTLAAGAAWRIKPQPIAGFTLKIEPDASAAMAFAAAALLMPGVALELAELPSDSVQGDARFLDVLAQMGAQIEREQSGVMIHSDRREPAAIDVDLTTMPDQAMTLATVACFAKGVSTIRGLKTLRDKECDRLAALAAELPKLGARVEVLAHMGVAGPDEGLRITPAATPNAPGEREITFCTYNDHRMAMAFALAGLRVAGGVGVADPKCVGKTHPGFWREFAAFAELDAPA